ncbi:MAG: response regulator [Rickettsiales bacterium]|jgi:DNA-binding response OmpR family regulator
MRNNILSATNNKSKLFSPSRFAEARILVVDDLDCNTKLICAKLSSAGYSSLEVAVDGIDALERTYKNTPDLVLLDIMMPNLDGFGYCERIRGDSSVARMPIIVQTALDDRETKLRALSCGADDFLNKPLDLDEVALRVYVHLERYFMLQDLENMRCYLKMELEQAQITIKHLEEEVVSESGRKLLNKHYEVLEIMSGAVNKEQPTI